MIKSIDFLVEISGIEPLTFPAIDAGKPPKADLIEIQEVSGVQTNPRQRKKTGMKPVFFVGGDKRDRTADLLNAIYSEMVTKRHLRYNQSTLKTKIFPVKSRVLRPTYHETQACQSL